jgi:hypothetical protein
MSFTKITDKHAAILQSLSEEHRHAALWLPFEAVRIGEVFTREEARQAALLLEDLREASDDNERAERLQRSMEISARVVLKLLRLARIV